MKDGLRFISLMGVYIMVYVKVRYNKNESVKKAFKVG